MGKYRVTIIFDRVNPKTKKLEKNMERFGEFFAKDQKEAKKIFLDQFKKNEPTRRKVHKVSILLLDTIE